MKLEVGKWRLIFRAYMVRTGRFEVQTLDRRGVLTWYSDTYCSRAAAFSCADAIRKSTPKEKTQVMDLDAGRVVWSTP